MVILLLTQFLSHFTVFLLLLSYLALLRMLEHLQLLSELADHLSGHIRGADGVVGHSCALAAGHVCIRLQQGQNLLQLAPDIGGAVDLVPDLTYACILTFTYGLLDIGIELIGLLCLYVSATAI